MRQWEPTQNFITALVTQNESESDRRSARPGRPVATVVGCARRRPARWIIDSNGTTPFVAHVQEGRSASPPRRPTVRWSSANITPFPIFMRTRLQSRRREMLTEAFKLPPIPPIDSVGGIRGEGTQSELIRGYGLRHARYRGR